MVSSVNAFNMRLLIVLSDETANVAIFSCFLFPTTSFQLYDFLQLEAIRKQLLMLAFQLQPVLQRLLIEEQL